MPNKTSVFPFDEATSPELLDDTSAYNAHVQAWLDTHPEVFSATIGEGWSLNGLPRESVKQGIRLRRIVTRADNEVWPIRPAFVMPYMTCDTATAEKMLFLQKWAPGWAFAHVFEKAVMTIHRLTGQMGRDSLVGTTVKHAEHLPEDGGADEKHGTLSGETVSAATTVGDQWVLGASLSGGAGEADVTEAYRQFQREAQPLKADYQPSSTVNTDCRACLGGRQGDEQPAVFAAAPTRPGMGRRVARQSVENDIVDALSETRGISSSL